MPNLNVDQLLLAAVLSGILSFFFSYFPWVRVKYAALTPEAKSGINIGGLVLITVVIFAGGCYSWFSTNIACTQAGAWQLISMLIVNLATNQSAYTATKWLQPGDVKAIAQAKLVVDVKAAAVTPTPPPLP